MQLQHYFNLIIHMQFTFDFNNENDWTSKYND